MKIIEKIIIILIINNISEYDITTIVILLYLIRNILGNTTISMSKLVEYIMTIGIVGILYNINNLLTLFINIEIFSLSIIILLYKRYSYINNLNILNYYIISSLSSLSFLYSILVTYSYKGELIINNINYITTNNLGYTILIASILIKLGIGPFYIYKVELYNQIENKYLLFLLTVPMYIYTTLIHNIINKIGINREDIITKLLIIIILTLIIGSIDYYKYNKINIILLYSSIYNTAIVLYNMILTIYNISYNMYVYILIYIINTIGLIKGLKIGNKNNRMKSIYKGIIILNCVSLMGFPPFGGFFGKMYVLINALNLNSLVHFFIFILIILTSIQILPIYLKVINYLFFKSGQYTYDIRKETSNINIIYPISSSLILILFTPFILVYIPLL